jgi:hypothetical protein
LSSYALSPFLFKLFQTKKYYYFHYVILWMAM